MLNFFEYDERLLNEREKLEGIDPLKMIDRIEREMGRFEEEELINFKLNIRTDCYTFYLRSAGSELNEAVPSMRAIYRFPYIDDPALILKAFNEERHIWSQCSYQTIEYLD